VEYLKKAFYYIKRLLILWTKIVLFKRIKVTLSIYIKGRLFLNCYAKHKILAISSYTIIKRNSSPYKTFKLPYTTS